MQFEISSTFIRFFFVVLMMVAFSAVHAKPSHYQDANSQIFNNDPDLSALNNMYETGLKPWQLEILAQRMAELNQFNQYNNLNGQEFDGFQRALRSGNNEIKRQSRYRLCYFNPVSCFKK